MPGTISRHRNCSCVALSVLPLLFAGCSGGSASTSGSGQNPGGEGSGPSSAASSDDSGSSSGSIGTSSGASSSSSDGSDDAGEEDEAAGDASVVVGPTTGRPPRDGGSEADGGTVTTSHDASVGDASSTGTSSADGGDPLAAARAQCVQIINQDRATLSPASPPLEEDTAEESCVDGQAMADFQANTAHSAFGKCKESAQDECPNWPGPPSAIMTKCLAQMWAEGPPAAGQDNHWLNMSNAHYKKVACGFYQTPSGGWWATQDFY